MKKILLCIYISFFLSNAIASEIENNTVFSDPLLISLGFNCTVTNMLTKYNLRCYAFPFDWNRTSFSGLCALLEDNFHDLLNPEHLSNQRNYILNTKYIIGFYHDFNTVRDDQGLDWISDNWLNEVESLKIKYTRRINRFYDALNSGHTIYFIRTNTRSWTNDTSSQTKQDIEQLRNILVKKFPNTTFILVALSNNDEYKYDWGMPCVKNFYLHHDTSEKEYYSIFKALGLI